MWTRIRDWFREERRWHRHHVTAWSLVKIPGPSGLTEWQALLPAAIDRMLSERGIHAEAWQRLADPCPYLYLPVPEHDLAVWVYEASANVSNVGGDSVSIFEEWASETPEDLVAQVCGEVESRLNRGAG